MAPVYRVVFKKKRTVSGMNGESTFEKTLERMVGKPLERNSS
jgi:hypothetical protein